MFSNSDRVQNSFRYIIRKKLSAAVCYETGNWSVPFLSRSLSRVMLGTRENTMKNLRDKRASSRAVQKLLAKLAGSREKR